MHNNYFLLRHGQTPWQAENLSTMYPWPDPPVPVTEHGITRIKEQAEILAQENIHAIYSSDLYRTMLTAQIVADRLRLEINPDSRLRDLSFGIYHGKAKEEFWKEFPRSNYSKRMYQAPPEGESWKDCQKRVKPVIDEIESKYQNKNILIVSHGVPLLMVQAYLEGTGDEELIRKMEEWRTEGKSVIPETGELRIIKNH